jgi:hypothetical protein
VLIYKKAAAGGRKKRVCRSRRSKRGGTRQHFQQHPTATYSQGARKLQEHRSIILFKLELSTIDTVTAIGILQSACQHVAGNDNKVALDMR